MTGQKGKITALAGWFGGKRTLAARIVEALGPHRCYWEPFCGSMAVLLNKPACNQETANDLHKDLTNLARVIQSEDLAPRLHWRLRRTLPAEGLFRESLAVVRGSEAPDAPCVGRAYHYFIASWLGMGGVAGVQNTNTGFARRFSSKGGDAATRFVAAVDSLPWWHDRLRSVLVLRSDGIELCEKIEDRAGTAVYVDPPYIAKGAEYRHDFAPADHERLAAAMARFKLTRVVVSYYDHAEVDRLYGGWHKLKLAAKRSLCNTGRPDTKSEAAPEVLLINQPQVEHGRGEARAGSDCGAGSGAAILQDEEPADAG